MILKSILQQIAATPNLDPALARVLNLTDAKRSHDRFNPDFQHSAFTQPHQVKFSDAWFERQAEIMDEERACDLEDQRRDNLERDA